MGSGGWKAFTFEDSAKYAKNYKLGIAKKVSEERGEGVLSFSVLFFVSS